MWSILLLFSWNPFTAAPDGGIIPDISSICTAGSVRLLTFGIGGMAVVYVLVPFLDGVFRKLPARTLMVTACILTAVFAADQVYSMKYPNEGKGITDFQEVTVGKGTPAGPVFML